MKKLSRKEGLQVTETGERQALAELSESQIAQIAGGTSCSWFEKEFGWITHGGYPPAA
jgi:hypothetical protein